MTSLRIPAALLVVAVLSGCATRDQGVIETLPEPFFAEAPAAKRAPAARPSQPRPVTPPVTRQPVRPIHPEWNPPGGFSNRWECIVLHHSASDSGGARAFHVHHTRVNHWDELGYHFVIGNGTETADGQVEVGPRWSKQKHGAHCKVPGNYYNEHGIGICLVGNFEHSHPSPAQMTSLEELIRFLMDRGRISAGQIFTHRGVTGRTACPGRRFPTAELKRRLARSPLAVSR